MNLLIRYMMDLLTSCLRHFLAEKKLSMEQIKNLKQIVSELE